jgi:hypothetical protein
MLARAQYAAVVGESERHLRGVEELQQRLGEVARGPEVVAQFGEGHRAAARDERHDPPADDFQRLRMCVAVAPDADREPGADKGLQVLAPMRGTIDGSTLV